MLAAAHRLIKPLQLQCAGSVRSVIGISAYPREPIIPSSLSLTERCQRMIDSLQTDDLANLEEKLIPEQAMYEALCRKIGQNPQPYHWETGHSHDTVLQQTQCWMKAMQHLSMWPYHIYDAQINKASFQVSTAASLKGGYMDYWRAALQLAQENEEDAPSAFIVIPQLSSDLVRFTCFAADNRTQLEMGMPELAQFGLFHPLSEVIAAITLAVSQESQAFKYWRRSPYPILHLQRKEMVCQRVRSRTAAEAEKNHAHCKALLEAVGIARLQAMLDAKDWSTLPLLLDEARATVTVNSS